MTEQGDGHDVLRAHDYAQPFSEAEIEEMWETHAGDNPECQTCRILITLAHVGAPGGAAADRAERGLPLDVERLARAMANALAKNHAHIQHETSGFYMPTEGTARAIAAEYARLAADPQSPTGGES